MKDVEKHVPQEEYMYTQLYTWHFFNFMLHKLTESLLLY